MADMTTMTERSSGVRGSNAVAEWTPPRGRKRWQLEDGEAMVAALHASGDTVAGFARRHGVQEARVQRWVARVGRKPHASATGQPVVFAPVRVTTRPATAGEHGRGPESGLDVVVGGAVVRVSHGFDGTLLRRVVEVLGERHAEPAADGTRLRGHRALRSAQAVRRHRRAGGARTRP
jgi:transposase-like protein